MEIKTKATEILEKHLGKDQCSSLFNNNELLWDDIIEAINEALSINGVSQQRELLVAYELNKLKYVSEAYSQGIAEKTVDEYLATNCG